MAATILCPKCRALGLTTDCADRLTMHPDDEEYELEVTMRFAVPVTSSLDLDPVEMATRMREKWINDEGLLKDVLDDAVDEDYDLTVRPVFYQ